MKNIFKNIVSITIIFLVFACSKEIEFGSDFNFKINQIDNTKIVVNTDKSFSLEVLNQFNKSNSKKFTISYNCSNVDIINNNTTLLQNNNYPLTANESNLIPLVLNAKQKGDFTMTILLTDEFGITKEQKILIKVVDDLNFEFKANNPQTLYSDIITTTFDFSMTLNNIGSGSDTYKIKAFSTLAGTIKVNNNLLQQNTFTSINLGNISASFAPDMLGVQKITFVIQNSNNVEKEVSFNLDIKPKPFTLTPIAILETKQTLNKNFTFSIANTIPNWEYKVKFQSNRLAKISTTGGLNIPLNTYVKLTPNTANFTYVYTSDAVGTDIITITVEDQYGQIKTNQVNVNVFSRPTINSVEGKITKKGSILDGFYKIQGALAFGGATITEYEFKVLNYNSGNYDTYNQQQILNYLYKENVDPDNGVRAQYVFYFLNNAHSQITNEDRTINYYWNQPYTVRVKDSDGVWSDIINGTVTY